MLLIVFYLLIKKPEANLDVSKQQILLINLIYIIQQGDHCHFFFTAVLVFSHLIRNTRILYLMMIYKTFSFDAAHYLPHVPKGHKCGGMHGHTYTLKVFLTGPLHGILGWILDYTDLKHGIKPIIELIDHKLLNEIPGLENPTSEQLCIWLWKQIKPIFPELIRIELNETPTSGVIYEG